MDKYFTVNAAVLKVNNYSESSRILTLLTAEYGLLKVNAKAVRRKDSRNLNAAQPFAFSRYELARGRGDLNTLVSSELIENFYGLADDIDRFMAAGDVTALVLKTVTENQPAPEVLRLYLNTLFALSYGSKPPAVIRTVFALRLFGELGFMPDAGVAVLKYCPELKDGLREAVLRALEHILTAEPQKLFGFSASDDITGELGRIAARAEREEI